MPITGKISDVNLICSNITAQSVRTGDLQDTLLNIQKAVEMWRAVSIAMDGKKNSIIRKLIRYINARKNKCIKNRRAECPFYHNKAERRGVAAPQFDELSLAKHTSYNPNHFNDLLTPNEYYKYQPFQGYEEQPVYYPPPACVPQYYQFPPPVYQNMAYPYQKCSPTVSYPQNNWYGEKGIFYSPQPITARLDAIKQSATSGSGVKTKPTSKLSTKSPHAITGHRFDKDKTPSNVRSFKPNYALNNNSKTPPVSKAERDYPNQTFEQVSGGLMNNNYINQKDGENAKT